MTNKVVATTPTRYRLNGFAQVMEMVGLAIMGALCGTLQAGQIEGAAASFCEPPANR